MVLFTHFSIIRKDIFNDFQKYGRHYCNAKQQVFGWDYSGKHTITVMYNPTWHFSLGISNQTEFNYILNNLIWIRRTDDDIAPSERIF